MTTANIIITQAAVSGTAGVSRKDIVTGQLVTLTNESNTGVSSWRWSFVNKPPSSAATLSGAATNTATFTPDVAGSYLVQLSIDEGRGQQVQRRLVAVVQTMNGVAGLRMPAAHEQDEANWESNADGWWPDVRAWLLAGSNASLQAEIDAAEADIADARVDFAAADAVLQAAIDAVEAEVDELQTEVVWSLDWTAEATQNMDTNVAGGSGEPYTVGGETFRALNTDRSTAFGITSGTGLVITATSGTTRTFDGGSNPDSPAGWFELDDLIPANTSRARPWTFWFHLSANTCASNLNAIFLGLWSPTGTGYSGSVEAVGIYHTGGQATALLQRAGTEVGSVSALGSWNVFAMRIASEGCVEAYAGAWASGWPSLDQMTLYAKDLSPLSTATITAQTLLRRAGMRLAISAITNAASGAPSLTLAHSKIEVG